MDKITKNTSDMKKKNNYLAPEALSIVLEVEQCLATSGSESSDNGFVMDDFEDGGEL